MGVWVPASDEKRDEKRDEAKGNHIDHWAQYGGTPNPDVLGPGYEAGWQRANDMRHNGEPDVGDVQEYAKTARDEEHYHIPRNDPDDHWEWEHGYWQGMTHAYGEGHWENENEEEELHEEGGEE